MSPRLNHIQGATGGRPCAVCATPLTGKRGDYHDVQRHLPQATEPQHPRRSRCRCPSCHGPGALTAPRPVRPTAQHSARPQRHGGGPPGVSGGNARRRRGGHRWPADAGAVHRCCSAMTNATHLALARVNTTTPGTSEHRTALRSLLLLLQLLAARGQLND